MWFTDKVIRGIKSERKTEGEEIVETTLSSGGNVRLPVGDGTECSDVRRTRCYLAVSMIEKLVASFHRALL